MHCLVYKHVLEIYLYAFVFEDVGLKETFMIGFVLRANEESKDFKDRFSCLIENL